MIYKFQSLYTYTLTVCLNSAVDSVLFVIDDLYSASIFESATQFVKKNQTSITQMEIFLFPFLFKLPTTISRRLIISQILLYLVLVLQFCLYLNALLQKHALVFLLILPLCLTVLVNQCIHTIALLLLNGLVFSVKDF